MVNRATLILIVLVLFTAPSESFVPQRRRVAPKSSTTPCRRFDVVAGFETLSSFRRSTRLAENPLLGGNESDGSQNDKKVISLVLKRDDSPTVYLLPKAYIFAKYLFVVCSLLIFATPDLSWGILLQQKWSGAAGYACASALCDILQNANANGRQSSDTYKRLHIALALFSLMSLTAVPGEAGFFRLVDQGKILALLTGARIMGALVALWGRKASVHKNVVQELAHGIVNTIKGLRVRDRKKALYYRNSFLIVLSAAISSFFQGRFLRSYQTEFLKTSFEISLQWSAVARLSMIAVMILTLKDAAERDRLDGKTFIQLNLLVGMAAVVVGLGQAMCPVGPVARRGVLFFFFSGLFFLKAYKGQITKKLNNEKQDEK